MLVDYHMHLATDHDPVVGERLSVEAVCARARAAHARGIEEICITEHTHRFAAVRGLFDDPFWNDTAVTDLAEYVAVVSAAGVVDGVAVLRGIELDWVPGIQDALARIVEPFAFDLVLGSVHWLDGRAVDLPGGIWEHYDVATVWRRYFAELRAAALSGAFDVMAHPDLVKIFDRRPGEAVVEEEFRATAEAFAAAGVASEVNTAGLRKPVGELYPDARLLELLCAAGVPLSLGSDAHVLEDVGRDFDRALVLAHGAGYRTVSRFRDRQREQVPLG